MWGQCYGAALWGRGSHRHSAVGYGATLWGRGTLRAHRDSAIGQRYGAGGSSDPIGTALWGSAMRQGDPLIPWGQCYGAALWGRGTL